MRRSGTLAGMPHWSRAHLDKIANDDIRATMTWLDSVGFDSVVLLAVSGNRGPWDARPRYEDL